MPKLPILANLSPAFYKFFTGLLIATAVFVVPLLVAFWPLLLWPAVKSWWIITLWVVCFFVLIDKIFSYRGGIVLMALIITLLAVIHGGYGAPEDSVVVYAPPGEASVVERRGSKTIYPWWRMEHRTIYRDTNNLTLRVEDNYLADTGDIAEIKASFDYYIPDDVLLNHHGDGISMDYEQAFRRAVMRALAQTLAKNVTPETLMSTLEAQIADETKHIGQVIKSISIRWAAPGAVTTLEKTM